MSAVESVESVEFRISEKFWLIQNSWGHRWGEVRELAKVTVMGQNWAMNGTWNVRNGCLMLPLKKWPTFMDFA